MNQLKVGNFIAEMRKEKGLTQEQLGEKMGVTNKTISRWETGKYMPDIDKLQDLSAALEISVNELLSGEKIEDVDAFVKKADANLVEALAESNTFGLQERIDFYKKKWMKEHKGFIVLGFLVWFLLLGVAICLKNLILSVSLPIIAMLIYGYIRNQMMIYVESHAFKKVQKTE